MTEFPELVATWVRDTLLERNRRAELALTRLIRRRGKAFDWDGYLIELDPMSGDLLDMYPAGLPLPSRPGTSALGRWIVKLTAESVEYAFREDERWPADRCGGCTSAVCIVDGCAEARRGGPADG